MSNDEEVQRLNLSSTASPNKSSSLFHTTMHNNKNKKYYYTDNNKYPLAKTKTPQFLKNFKFIQNGVESTFKAEENKKVISDDDGDYNVSDAPPSQSHNHVETTSSSWNHFYSNLDRKRSYSDGDDSDDVVSSPRKRVDVTDRYGGVNDEDCDNGDSEIEQDNEDYNNEQDNNNNNSSPHLSLLSPSISPITSEAPNNNNNNEQQQQQQQDDSSECNTMTIMTTNDTNITSSLSNIPSMIESFEELPDQIKRYVLFNMLRRCDRTTLSVMSGLIIPALRCNFVASLPLELAHTILSYLDAKSMCRAAQVSKTWKNVVDSADWVWKDLLNEDKFNLEPGDLEKFSSMVNNNSAATKTKNIWGVTPAHTPVNEDDGQQLGIQQQHVPIYKTIYKHKYLVHNNWMNPNSNPKYISLPGHGRDVVTCLQFDDDKIVTGSDDHTINVYDTKTGKLRTTLRGHDGGVWALQYIDGNTLVSGSTDRTVRIWNIKEEKCTHIFYGHTSTVRCLDILHPVEINDPDEPGKTCIMPKEPMIVTGSRDSTLRVWRLPNEHDPEYLPLSSDTAPPDVFFQRALTGHTHNVRVISGYGDTVVSGSYDNTVRVWKVSTGECQWELTGHSGRVYSTVLDTQRNRCISGSMDWTVKVWCLETGSLLYTLEGHTSLVGLLDLNRSSLVSAAADATLRVWNPETGEFLHKLKGHQGAITCFQHDEHKVVSGSENTLKLWDVRTGKLVRDLLVDLNRIWQVKFDDKRCVAAVKRNNDTYIEVLDFERTNNSYTIEYNSSPSLPSSSPASSPVCF